MKKIDRIYKEAELYISTALSIRELAEQLHVSKSTLHDDLNMYLSKYDKELYERVRVIAAIKKSEAQFS